MTKKYLTEIDKDLSISKDNEYASSLDSNNSYSEDDINLDNETSNINLQAYIPEDYAGLRFDAILAKLFPDFSREKLKKWIISGECLFDNKVMKPKDKAIGNELVSINAVLDPVINWGPEDLNIDLDIVYEDEDLIVINKPANLVVHPGNANSSGTLINYLVYKFPELNKLPRGGIVHRLDKDTTGLMVVARSLKAYKSLTEQLKDKTVTRIYDAVVWGVRISGGKVDEPISRNPKDRTKMAVVHNNSSRQAVTNFKIAEKFSKHMHLKVALETGRTHQIRVHMDYINHPLVGDKTYGRKRLLHKAPLELQVMLDQFPRQALHASHLELLHPSLNKNMSWEVDLPKDMQDLLSCIRDNN